MGGGFGLGATSFSGQLADFGFESETKILVSGRLGPGLIFELVVCFEESADFGFSGGASLVLFMALGFGGVFGPGQLGDLLFETEQELAVVGGFGAVLLFERGLGLEKGG